jgi:hypothetical protein
MPPSSASWPRPKPGDHIDTVRTSGEVVRTGVGTLTDALACFPAGRGISLSWKRPWTAHCTGFESLKTHRSNRRNICCVSDAIERVIADVQRYSEAGERLAEHLHQQAQWNIDDIAGLRSGVSLIEACQKADSADRSRTMTRLLAQFEESRRAIRSSSVLGLLEEGLTITEIGQVFGVSRQLANRLVKDARAMYGEASTTV